MASEGTFKQILKTEANRNTIEGIFKRIDEATKTFQVDPNLLLDYQFANQSHPARYRLEHRENGE